MLDNDVIVTVGHKVAKYVDDPSHLTVRLGDWNPNEQDPKEKDIPHVEAKVDCVKIHPDADLEDTVRNKNNVAILKLRTLMRIKLKDVITPFTYDTKENNTIDTTKWPKRPANAPDGIEGFSILDRETKLDKQLSIAPFNIRQEAQYQEQDVDVPLMYINTVCLPRTQDQFENYNENCWVAAWGKDLERQREVDIPLVSTRDCEKRLGPVFREKGIADWSLKPSELCAGGVPGKGVCEGEGGSPLVCYDKVK